MIKPRFAVDLDDIPVDRWGCLGWILGSVLAVVGNAALIYGIVKLVRWAWEA